MSLEPDDGLESVDDPVYITDTGALPNDLNNEVHSVFRRERWLNLEEPDYAALEPTLRLASLMLQSPASLAYLCALMDSPRTRLDLKAAECYSFHKVDYDDIRTKARVLDFLRQLAPHVSCMVCEPIPGEDNVKGSAMRVRTNRPITMDGIQRSGPASLIRINPSYVKCLCDLLSKEWASSIPGAICLGLHVQYFIATVLCYEIIHACHMALFPESVLEPFYEDERINELGDSWTQAVLGASALHYNPLGRLEAALMALKWPNNAVKTDHARRKYARRGSN